MSVLDNSTVQVSASVCFFLAILHTFSVQYFNKIAHRYRPGSVGENFFHLLGEVEIVFGLWAALLAFVIGLLMGFPIAQQYLETREFTEPMLVFVLMVICSTRPILKFAESAIEVIAKLIPIQQSLSFYISVLVVGPLLGSFITEPAAMTVIALILLDRYYQKGISANLMYATLGLLFVNVSIGGTLTPYAAPPVLMVAGKWGWDLTYMFTNFGWKAAVAVTINTLLVAYFFRSELLKIKDHKKNASSISIPFWVILVHLLFLAMVVVNHHSVVVFFGFFLFFLGIYTATTEYQGPLQLKSPMLVAFFLAGLIVLGGLQSWWLKPLLARLDEVTLYIGAVGLTAFTDNAAITYLGSQVEGLSETSKYLLVAGSVVGGGLTVIANAPNPAGYSILSKCFGQKGIEPLKLAQSALLPTLIAGLCFWLL
jgi:hypothetical protein